MIYNITGVWSAQSLSKSVKAIAYVCKALAGVAPEWRGGPPRTRKSGKMTGIFRIIQGTWAGRMVPVGSQEIPTNSDFASGPAVPSGVGDSSTFNCAAFSTAFTLGPTSYSMENSGGGGYSVPGAYQYDAATPGASYLLTGYDYIPTALTGASEGFLQVTFVDSTKTQNLGTVQTSPGNALVSTPISSSSSPSGTWIQMSEIATAPAGSAYIEPFTLVLDATPATVYFDDLSLTAVPEPVPFGYLARRK